MLFESNSDIKSKENLNKFLNYCISKLSSIIIQATFLHPQQNQNVQKIGRFIISSLLLIPIAGLVVTFVLEVQKDSISSIVLTQSLFEFIYLTAIQICYAILIFKENKMLDMMQSVSHIWFCSDFTEKQTKIKIIKIMEYLSQLIAVSIIILGNGFVVATVCVPIFSSWIHKNAQITDKNLPLHTNFLIDENKYFYQIFILHFCSSNVFSVLVGALNTLLCFAIANIIGELHNLQYYLKKIDQEYGRAIKQNRKKACVHLYKNMKEVIRKHHQCIRLFETLNGIVNPIMLVAVVTSFLNLVISAAWAMILMQTNKAEALKMFCGFCCAALTLIISCIPGQLLSNASEDFLVQNYFIGWQNYPPDIRSMIVLFMAKEMRLFVLTGGPTIALNFETCSQILKMAISFALSFRSIYVFN